MSLPYSSSTPADDPLKKEECHKAALAVRNMLEKVKWRCGVCILGGVFAGRVGGLPSSECHVAAMVV